MISKFEIISAPRRCIRAGRVDPMAEDDRGLNGQSLLADSRGTDNFALELREFAAALREGRPPLASGREVRPVVEVLEACRRSRREKTVVELHQVH